MLKRLLLYGLLVASAIPVFGQFYLRGEVISSDNKGLGYAKIFLHSTRTFYSSGAMGSFGINSPKQYDSVTISKDGYITQTLRIKTDEWQKIQLVPAQNSASLNRPKLISLTSDRKQASRFGFRINEETYFQLVENEFVPAWRYPNTGFSLNVNKASFSNIRRFIVGNSKVPPDAVRIEECINYFNLRYEVPDSNEIFGVRSQLSDCPWSPEDQLLFININARKLNLDKVPPGNFVFLIDVSGSMDMPNRLPLLKAAFQNFVKQLRPIDRISIVMYGGTVGIWLPPTPGDQHELISEAIESLTASGDTPGESAIMAAYKLAESSFIEGGSNRVILATDGDFNVGQSSEKALDELITKMRQTGVYLTCLGVGMGNFKDSKLETLAKKGNGNYAYLDNSFEAEKVLIKELTQTLYAVADDVSLNVDFNPTMVKEYRLIGFDNKRDAVQDPDSELEGGEIGSGSSTLAIFQIVPTRPNNNPSNIVDEIADIRINYNRCSDTSKNELNYRVENNYLPIDQVHPDLKFASAVAMFGMLLKDSKYQGNNNWGLIKTYAMSATDPEKYLQSQFLSLVESAYKIYNPEKKRRRAR